MTRQPSDKHDVNVQGWNIDAFSERLRDAFGSRSPYSLEKQTGIAQSLLRKYLSGQSVPGLDKAVVLAAALGVSLEELATGHKAQQGGIGVTVNLDVNEYALVPRYDIQVSAGPGALVDQEEEVGYYPFKREWLRREGLSPKDLALVTVKGDSMAPTLSEGDMLLVDRSEHQVRRDSIYVLRINDDVIAKRLQRDFADGLWVRSDNDQYEDQHLDKAAAAALNIVGRVVWFGRRI